MKCPTDGTTLTMSERSGIEIDYCPQCRGVWLDRGELDKILDRATQTVPAPPTPQAPAQQWTQPSHQAPYPQDHRGEQRRRRKKEHWLSELFD